MGTGRAFTFGFIEGAAKAVDRNIQQDIKDSKEGVRTAKDFHIRRKEAAQNKYLDQLEKADEKLEMYASLTNGNFEEAASLISGIGGVSQADTYFPIVKAALARGTPLNEIAKFTPPPANTPARSKQQLMEHFATLRMPTLPEDVGKPTGWAKILGGQQPSIKDAVERETARLGLPTEAPERVGIISPAVVSEALLDPDAARKEKERELELTAKELQNEKYQGDIDLIESKGRKIDAEVANMPAKAQADLALTMAKLRGEKLDAEQTEFLLKTAREQDPIKHKLFVQAQQTDILRKQSSGGQAGHTAFLLQHNEELAMIMRNNDENSTEYMDAMQKKDANDRVLGVYAKYLEGEAQRDLMSKINPISAFNGILETAFAGENITFEAGFSDQISRVIEGETLAVNRAYNNAIASFRTSYSSLGVAALAYVNAQTNQMKRNEAGYVGKEYAKYLEDTKAYKNLGNLYEDKIVTVNNQKVVRKQKIPNSKLQEGKLYYNPYLIDEELNKKRGTPTYAIPYAVWSGNGWLMPALKSED